MTRISISFRIAIFLALISLCGVLLARVSGLFPDTQEIQAQGRMLPFVEFAIFITGFNAVVFIIWLRRFLMQLDPSRVMPQQVRSELDTLAEGVLVINSEGRIVMANKTFASMIGQQADQLQGRVASDLPWTGKQDLDELPWQETIRENSQLVGIPLQLKTDAEDKRSFHVNVAPIFGEDGENRGALASFDDVTDLEFKKVELIKMLKTLKASREEIQEQNNQLRLLATIDPLTECMNRRSFFPLFDQHWEDSQINKKPLCGFMVDIDQFKLINDDHGHAKGDEVLKRVAACLREQIGDEGLICRFGGEEFCVLLPGFDLKQAVARAEQIRVEMSKIDFTILTVTASVGVSSIEFGASNPQEMLEQADKCLYVAKRNGRNKVVTYTADMENLEVDESKIRRAKPKPKAEGDSSHTHIPFPAVASLMSALAYRHAETAEHSTRVADLCVAVARGLMSVSEAYILEIAALLHDIGKIGVPDAILLKPGELTAEEWRVMKMNERIGVEIVGSAFYYEPLVDVIRFHKAPYDSRNDVKRVPSGDELPLGARILAIADAYDSMVTKRSYREARSRDEAFSELRRCASTQFDPQIVERFIEVVAGKPQPTQPPTGKMSRQTALQIATQIEELARALDEQDLAAIEALATRLRATAACAGATEVETLADKLSKSATLCEDASEIFELTIELMDLCRSAQRAAVSSLLPASTS